MPKLIVKGIEYDFPVLDTLTGRESGLIKRMSGVRTGEIMEALHAGDAELVVAVCVIAMRRAGAEVDEREMLDIPLTAFEVKPDPEDEEGEASPPDGAADAAPDEPEDAAKKTRRKAA